VLRHQAAQPRPAAPVADQQDGAALATALALPCRQLGAEDRQDAGLLARLLQRHGAVEPARLRQRQCSDPEPRGRGRQLLRPVGAAQKRVAAMAVQVREQHTEQNTEQIAISQALR